MRLLLLLCAIGFPLGVSASSNCTVPRGCDADVADNNALVNVADLAAVLSLWGSLEVSTQPFICADQNGDSQINIEDLVALITHWGPCPASCPLEPAVRVEEATLPQCPGVRVCRVYARLPRGLRLAAVGLGEPEDASSGLRTQQGPLYSVQGLLRPSELLLQVTPSSACQSYIAIGETRSPRCPVLSPGSSANLSQGLLSASAYCLPSEDGTLPPPSDSCESLVAQVSLDPLLASGPVQGPLELYLDDGSAVPLLSRHQVSCLEPPVCCCVWARGEQCFPGVHRSACVPPQALHCQDDASSTPTTAAPTTESPTTESPTTVSPTSASPTSASPTSAAPTTAAPPNSCPAQPGVRLLDSSLGHQMSPDLDPRCLSGSWPPGSPGAPASPLQVCRVFARLPAGSTLVAGRFGERPLHHSGLSAQAPLFGSAALLYPGVAELHLRPWSSCFTYVTMGHSQNPSCPQLSPTAASESNLTAGLVKGSFFCVPESGPEVPDESCEILVFQASMAGDARGPLQGNLTLFLDTGAPLPLISTHRIQCFTSSSRSPSSAPPSSSPGPIQAVAPTEVPTATAAAHRAAISWAALAAVLLCTLIHPQ